MSTFKFVHHSIHCFRGGDQINQQLREICGQFQLKLELLYPKISPVEYYTGIEL